MFFHHILIILNLDFSSFHASLTFKSQKSSFPLFKANSIIESFEGDGERDRILISNKGLIFRFFS